MISMTPRVVTVAPPSRALALPGGASLSPKEQEQTRTRADVPLHTPFLIDEGGSLKNLINVNAYLLEASRQQAYTQDWLLRHAQNLQRLLVFVRSRQGMVDLTATSREDLVAYKAHRRTSVGAATWNTEFSSLSTFFQHAKASDWIEKDPTPRWGRQERSTLLERVAVNHRENFMLPAQSRFFLEVGLRGDAPAPITLCPAYPERDYTLGLILLATGMRRQEAGYLLNCEVPTAATLHPSGVTTVMRKGKGGKIRPVWFTTSLVDVIDLYRATDRTIIIKKAQKRLARKLAAGELLLVDRVQAAPTQRIIISGHARRLDLLGDDDRARAVLQHPDGTLEPLSLLLGEGGLPLQPTTLSQIFQQGRTRSQGLVHKDQPPAHLVVTPHVMRHTFAVRMLSALMEQGRSSDGNPYHLLSSPILVVQQLLGHSDPSTTQRYLRAAERYSEDIPAALRQAMAATLETEG